MKLTINKDPSLKDDLIDIQYRELTAPISRIVELCNQGSQTLIGEIDEKTYPIDISDILYLEWVEGRSCICTADKVYTSAQTLSQLEQSLGERGFIRVSKPVLVNVHKVKWLSSMLNMRLLAELINGEKITVSRRYRSHLLHKIHEMGKGANK